MLNPLSFPGRPQVLMIYLTTLLFGTQATVDVVTKNEFRSFNGWLLGVSYVSGLQLGSWVQRQARGPGAGFSWKSRIRWWISFREHIHTQQKISRMSVQEVGRASYSAILSSNHHKHHHVLQGASPPSLHVM